MATRPEGATPGPWSVNPDRRGDVLGPGKRGKVASVSGPLFESFANARLISAAPDLYQALKVMLEAVATGSANHLKLAQQAAYAAVRKADGDAT